MRRLVQLIDETHVGEDVCVARVVDSGTAFADLYDPAGRSSARKTERATRAASG